MSGQQLFSHSMMQQFIGSSTANSCAIGNTESTWNIHNYTEAAASVVPIASELHPLKEIIIFSAIHR